MWPSLLVAEARIARQRELIAHLKARGEDTSEARAILGASDTRSGCTGSASVGRGVMAPRLWLPIDCLGIDGPVTRTPDAALARHPRVFNAQEGCTHQCSKILKPVASA